METGRRKDTLGIEIRARSDAIVSYRRRGKTSNRSSRKYDEKDVKPVFRKVKNPDYCRQKSLLTPVSEY